MGEQTKEQRNRIWDERFRAEFFVVGSQLATWFPLKITIWSICVGGINMYKPQENGRFGLAFPRLFKRLYDAPILLGFMGCLGHDFPILSIPAQYLYIQNDHEFSTYILVDGFNHLGKSWKIWVRQWDWWHPFFMKWKIKKAWNHQPVSTCQTDLTNTWPMRSQSSKGLPWQALQETSQHRSSSGNPDKAWASLTIIYFIQFSGGHQVIGQWRCEDEKMRYRPPLLEEPCAQTLSGKIFYFVIFEGCHPFFMMENKSHVPKHQPDDLVSF